MKHLLRAVSLAALCILLLCASACYATPPTVNPDGDSANPTVVISDTQLSTEELFALHDVRVEWSDLQGYIHTMTGDTAQFIVTDKSGATCTLDVTIDRKSGLLSEATLTYGNLRENFLDESIIGIVRIFRAMHEAGATQ